MPPPSGRYGTARYGGSMYGINWALAELPGPRWDLVACMPDGTALADLSGASARKLTFRLNDPSTVEWSMSGADPAAPLVDELSTDLVAYRNGVRLFRGRVGASGDDVTGDSHRISFSAVDYRALLARRTIWSVETPAVFNDVDQSTIARALIFTTQVMTGGNLGIGSGLGLTTGVLRDRTYEAGKNIAEAINQLSQVANGFDWDVSPELAFDVYYPARGVTRDFVAHHGATITAFKRQVDPSTYANAIRHSGADDLMPVTREVADLTTRREGRWELQAGDTDVLTDSTLEEKADWLLSESSVIRPSYTCTLAPGAWDGPATLWLGDTCRLILKTGRLDVDTTARVHEIAVTAGDDGGEVVEVTFDRPRSSFVRKASRSAARIDQLERR